MSQEEEWKDREEAGLEGYSCEPWLSLSWNPDETEI